MERIVNGHYADPNSTRDIVGITPDEFETLVRVLQRFYSTIEELLTATKEEREDFFKQVASSQLAKNKGAEENDIEMVMNDFENQFINDYNNCYQFMIDINQPYPGANYD